MRAAALAILALLAVPSLAHAAGTVRVVKPKGGEVRVSLDSVQPDVTDRSYKRGGGNVRVTGVSLGAVLKRAGAATGFDYAELADARGNGMDLDDQVALSLAGKPPVFYEEADGTVRFLSGSGGDGELVGPDFTVQLQKGFTIDVSISPSSPTVGGEVEFTASVDGAAPDPSYSWFFRDDKDTADGASVRHTYEKPGTYRVLLNVTPRAGEDATPKTVTVRVSEKDEEEPESRSTPDDGGASGGSGGGSGTGSGSGSGGGSGTGGGGGGTTPTPVTQDPEPSTRPPAPTTPAPTPATPPPAPAPTPATPPPDDADRVPAAGGEQPVAGLILSEVSTPAAAGTPAGDAGSARKTDDDDGGGFHVPVLVWELLGLALLLGAGWMLEGRGTRILRPHTWG